MAAPASGGDVGAGASRSAGCLRDTCTDLQFPVSDFICKYIAYLDSQRFVAMGMIGISLLLRHVRFQSSRDTLRWSPEWRGGGIGVFMAPLFVAAFSLVSTLRSCGVFRRACKKSHLGNSLLRRESWQCTRLWQQLNWFNLDGCSSPFISFRIEPTVGANASLSIESVLGVVIFSLDGIV